MKFNYLIAGMAVAALLACNSSTKQAEEGPAHDEQPVATSPVAPDTVVVTTDKREKNEGTTIKVGTEGVSVKSEETKVQLGKDTADIEIRPK